MLKTGCGEFALWTEKSCIVFYKTSSGFFKDIFINGRTTTQQSIEITKSEYLKKLKIFVQTLEKENEQ